MTPETGPPSGMEASLANDSRTLNAARSGAAVDGVDLRERNVRQYLSSREAWAGTKRQRKGGRSCAPDSKGNELIKASGPLSRTGNGEAAGGTIHKSASLTRMRKVVPRAICSGTRT